jgi:GT2 family glycosyltransferase
MPTKVVDLDLTKGLPARLEKLEGYDRVWALIRWNGRPLHRVLWNVIDGVVAGEVLQATILDSVGWNLYRAWMEDNLGLTCTGKTEYQGPLASIAVCTRDRPEHLKRCLASIERLPDDGQEVLVVDNCPATEATTELLESDFPWVRYVREGKPGLNRARNRAIREARHEVVAFVDDDATVDEGWLRALVGAFVNPLVICSTGVVLPYELETAAQEVFELHFGFSKRGFQKRTFCSTSHNPLAVGGIGAGANMALRRDVVDLIGPFEEVLDGGTPTKSGGDHELFSRILLAGFRIVYEPAAIVWHCHRRKWSDLESTLYGYGVGAYAWFTHRLFVDREPGILRLAYGWFRHEQLPTLVRAFLGRPSAPPFRLLLRQLWGCAVGPWAYFLSCRTIRAGGTD